jgi:hypothetical protein
MALTKADMAEHLFDELGLNKREAKDWAAYCTSFGGWVCV